MEKTYKKKDIEYTEDIKEQIYNLICKFAYSKPQIIEMLKTRENIEDFIMYAYVYYLDKLYPIFDPDKSALSTHVFSSMNKLYYLFITQVQQNVSLKDARRIAGMGNRYPEATQYYNALYKTASGLDVGSGSILYTDTDSGEDLEIPDLSLASDDEHNPYQMLMSTSVDVKDFADTYMGHVFDNSIDTYLSKKKTKDEIKQRDKEIIWKYTLRDGTEVTLQSLANEYGGMSRERVRQICEKYYDWARKHDKTLRDALKP